MIDVQVTPVFRWNETATEKTVINRGGAGSSKTFSLCQFYIFKRLLPYPNWKLLVVRKTRASMKFSVYQTFIEMLKLYNLYDEAFHNKTDFSYRFPNGALAVFAGIDDIEKIKSTEWNDIWVEEANQVRQQDYLFLKSTRLHRGQVGANTPRTQIRLSFNPTQCWISGIEQQKDTRLIVSTYHDNTFANPDFIAEVEALKEQDENYYKVYALGQYAVMKNIIYQPQNFVTEYPTKFDDEIYGMDFGFSNSYTALLWLGIIGNDVFEREIIYQTHLTNTEIIALMKELKVSTDKPIYADYENASGIEEIFQAGFNIIPCEKGVGSVKQGIDVCRRFRYYTCDDNENLNREHAGYAWQEDKNGTLIDKPIKFRDHYMDARRYALFTHLHRLGDAPQLRIIKV